MQYTPVTSTTIQRVGYDAETGILHVQFASGHTYEYSGIEPADHAALIGAKSVGAHFSKHIRPHFDGTRK